MFIKFTRLDGTPIWLNSTFIVTVEPRRGGGSVVVPIGDGLDYDVREAPEKVLALLEPSGAAPVDVPQPEAIAAELAKSAESAAPAAAPAAVETPAVEPVVVAVPPPKALPEKFIDVVAQGLNAPRPEEVDAKPLPETPVERKPVIDVTPLPADVAPTVEAKPAKKTTRTRKTKAAKAAETTETPSEGEAPAEAKPVKKATRTRKAKKAELTLDEAQLERLKRMMPGSVKKLQNTLVSQFRITDPEAEVKALVDQGVLTLENDHVVW